MIGARGIMRDWLIWYVVELLGKTTIIEIIADHRHMTRLGNVGQGWTFNVVT